MYKTIVVQLVLAVILVSVHGLAADGESSGETGPEKTVPEELPVYKVETIDNLQYLNGLPFLNMSQAVAENITLENATQEANVTQKYVSCLAGYGGHEVHLVNDTELIKLLLPDNNITSKETPGKCICVLFYSKYCPFSSLAAPHFNALPRAYPDVKMVAINAMMYHLFNTQNGIVGVPSLLLFHNGKVTAKFNESDYTLEQFSRFISKNTGIVAEEKSFVTSADFSGPVASVPSKDTDVFLALSWSFIVICAVYYFTKTRWWQWIVETVQSNWRESEAQAQHEHAE